MLKIRIIHGSCQEGISLANCTRRELKLAVILTFVRKYFVVPFPTTKPTIFFPLEKYPPYGIIHLSTVRTHVYLSCFKIFVFVFWIVYTKTFPECHWTPALRRLVNQSFDTFCSVQKRCSEMTDPVAKLHLIQKSSKMYRVYLHEQVQYLKTQES